MKAPLSVEEQKILSDPSASKKLREFIQGKENAVTINLPSGERYRVRKARFV